MKVAQGIKVFTFGAGCYDEECWAGRSFHESLAAYLLSNGSGVADVAAQLKQLGEYEIDESSFEFDEAAYDEEILNDVSDPASGHITYRQIIEELIRDGASLPCCISVCSPTEKTKPAGDLIEWEHNENFTGLRQDRQNPDRRAAGIEQKPH